MPTAKNSRVRKAPLIKKGAPRASRAKPKAQQITQPLPTLPAGFVIDGFEIVGDQVRVYGKVKHDAPTAGPDLSPAGIAGSQVAMAGQYASMAIQRCDAAPPPPAIVSRQSLLSEALQNQLALLHDVSCAMSDLEAATAFVTNPEAQGVGGNKSDPAPSRSEALGVLSDHAMYLTVIASRIRGLTSRLQS